MNIKHFLALAAILLLAGCGSQINEDHGFSTSGSRDADQRAEQRMAKAAQTSGKAGGPTVFADEKKTLYDRLGGEKGIQMIVDDFVPRAIADPRVNWQRKGVRRGGFSLKRTKSMEWNPSEENINKLKTHLVQFLAVATGGPPKYDGKDMKSAHANLRITNAEFDASIGDMKATLDKLAVPTGEQKELIAILESTRPQIVSER